MAKIKVARIRPVSWKIVVQGSSEAEAVRQLLEQAEIQTSEVTEEPSLNDPALFFFLATPRADSSVMSEELKSILLQDERIELGFGD